MQLKGFEQVLDALLKSFEENLGFVRKKEDIDIDQFDYEFLRSRSKENTVNKYELLQSLLVNRGEGSYDLANIVPLRTRAYELIVDRDLKKDNQTFNDFWNVNRQYLIILNHTHQIVKFEEICLIDFDGLQYFNYSKKELLMFLQKLGTRRALDDLQNAEIDKLISNLDKMDNKNNFGWRLARLLLTFLIYECYDDAAVVTEMIKAQLHMYVVGE